ncbi:hypothetical protein J2I46_24895 [Fibrella sp. HMF5405]|uniref:DUF3784 domain-containing protein n=2 Tax=Fibrella forsythiae TaxID=2817061 RepID=A0ABS3JPB8_9BACT|nr:hypothetical protein [Fibrella forsythiae]
MGAIIVKFRLANLIAGYDPGLVKNRKGLAIWMGKCAMMTGLLALVIALMNYLFLSATSDLFAFTAFMILSMISGVVALAGAQRYYK